MNVPHGIIIVTPAGQAAFAAADCRNRHAERLIRIHLRSISVTMPDALPPAAVIAARRDA